MLNGPDRWGRYSYIIYWIADYTPGHPDGEYASRVKGQVFFANPSQNGHDEFIEVDRQPEIWEVNLAGACGF